VPKPTSNISANILTKYIYGCKYYKNTCVGLNRYKYIFSSIKFDKIIKEKTYERRKKSKTTRVTKQAKYYITYKKHTFRMVWLVMSGERMN
jgi:hypothetical protein